jgi:hypothetical protein
MIRLRAIALCAVLMLPAPASAGPYEDGVAAYDRKDYAAALDAWLPLAQQGNAAAQFNVGVLYEKGLGVAQDLGAAARWYRKAAEQGDIEAQYDVGRLHETGSGVAKDLDEARRWYARVLASPQRDAAAAKTKEQARVRLAGLRAFEQNVVTYDGGRFVVVRSANGGCVVALQGAVTRETSSVFGNVIERSRAAGCESPWLLLESPGGLVDDAIDVGQAIRRAGFRTITRYSCASACAIIFLGGTERVLVGSRARIGVHQPAHGLSGGKSRCDATTFSIAARHIAVYLESVIPSQVEPVMKLFMETSCNDITWIAGARALELGIATHVQSQDVDVFGPAERRVK